MHLWVSVNACVCLCETQWCVCVGHRIENLSETASLPPFATFVLPYKIQL